MDETEKLDLQAQVLMLMHVTASLWANFLVNSGPDPLGTTRRITEESLDSLEGLYNRLASDEPNPGLHPTVQAILHHEENFWKQVESQVQTHRGSRRR
ncbi:hypothetical protein [Novosphingobium sp. AP12]|uniref:hypothetical protein n=1 Tax=Novosphingobium sp. AP12 TaxID=1144305 RepID=UPI000271DE16|nr:hypothetical protein [Novosphingobium sp. AP12]EJL21920.1 hypothetical protein PMI02_04905 [Novosphingobium sp. AP12]